MVADGNGNGGGEGGGVADVADDVIVRHDVAPGGAGVGTSAPAPPATTGAGADDVSASIAAVAVTGGGKRVPGLSTTAAASVVSARRAIASPRLPSNWLLSFLCKSHVDAVRFTTWLPRDGSGREGELHVPLLLTCSEDGAAKLWSAANQSQVVASGVEGGGGPPPGSRAPALPPSVAAHLSTHKLVLTEPDPVRTLRGHAGPVLSGCQVAWSAPAAGAGDEPGATLDAFMRAALAPRALPPDAAAKLAAASSATALIATGGADGRVCIWVRPRDVVPLPGAAGIMLGEPAWPPAILTAGYDLPAEASLPLLTFKAAASPVWAVVPLPPAFATPARLARLARPADPPPADRPAVGAASTRVPAFFTLAADGGLALWSLGVAAAGGVAATPVWEASVPALLAAAGIPEEDARAPATAAVADETVPELALLVANAAGVVAKIAVAARAATFAVRLPPPPPPTSTSSSTTTTGPVAPRARVTRLAAHPVLPMAFAAHDAPGWGVSILDTTSGATQHHLPAHATAVTGVAVDATGLMLATCGNDGDVRVWSVDSRECVRRQRVRCSHLTVVVCHCYSSTR